MAGTVDRGFLCSGAELGRTCTCNTRRQNQNAQFLRWQPLLFQKARTGLLLLLLLLAGIGCFRICCHLLLAAAAACCCCLFFVCCCCWPTTLLTAAGCLCQLLLAAAAGCYWLMLLAAVAGCCCWLLLSFVQRPSVIHRRRHLDDSNEYPVARVPSDSYFIIELYRFSERPSFCTLPALKLRYVLLSQRLSGLGCLKQRFSALLLRFFLQNSILRSGTATPGLYIPGTTLNHNSRRVQLIPAIYIYSSAALCGAVPCLALRCRAVSCCAVLSFEHTTVPGMKRSTKGTSYRYVRVVYLSFCFFFS